MPHTVSNNRKQHLERIALRIRHGILQATTHVHSGHLTSCLSAVELTTVLLFAGHFRADLRRPSDPRNDRLLFSKGHAAPLLYALYAAAGHIPWKELLTLRQFGSRLEGHAMPSFPYTDVPTGSLGQGISNGLGMALSARMTGSPTRVFVLLGDGEMAEGSVWEAVAHAGHARIGNLIGILDMNRLGQTGPTRLGVRADRYAVRLRAFGWSTIIADGHDIRAIDRAFHRVRSAQRPTMIIAKTIKGKGVSFLEDRNGWHGRPLTPEEYERAVVELGPVPQSAKGIVAKPSGSIRPVRHRSARMSQPFYPKETPVTTRDGAGNALVRLGGVRPEIVVLDADVANSTKTEGFAKRFPDRFLQCAIAEQNMVGMATGLAALGMVPVASTFAAFFSRAHDQLRMMQYAGVHAVFLGTHTGVSIGKDGPSQMGLEDLAMFRALHGSTVLYASDAYAAERLMELAISAKGIVYLRISRPVSPIISTPKTRFCIGGSQTLRRSSSDRVTVVTAGVTVAEALTATDELAQDHIAVRVLDCYSVKPIDAIALRKAVRETQHLLVVEDHRPEGGLADAVRSALGKDAGCVTSLAVTRIPKSGLSSRQLAYQGIDARGIIRAARCLAS